MQQKTQFLQDLANVKMFFFSEPGHEDQQKMTDPGERQLQNLLRGPEQAGWWLRPDTRERGGRLLGDEE